MSSDTETLKNACKMYNLQLQFRTVKSDDQYFEHLIISKAGYFIEYFATHIDLASARNDVSKQALDEDIIERLRQVALEFISDDVRNGRYHHQNRPSTSKIVNKISLYEYWSAAELFGLKFKMDSIVDIDRFIVTIYIGDERYTGEDRIELNAIYAAYQQIDFNYFFSQLNMNNSSTFELENCTKLSIEKKCGTEMIYRCLAKDTTLRGFFCKCETNYLITYAIDYENDLACKKAAHFMAKKLNVKLDYSDPHEIQLPAIEEIDDSKMKECVEYINSFSADFYDLVSIDTNEEVQKEIDMVGDGLCELIQSVFPDSHLELFGSINNGFGQIFSDLDFTIIPNNRDRQIMDRRRCISAIKQIRKLTKKKRRSICDVEAIVNARVPILRLNYKTNLGSWFQCDLSISNLLPVHKSNLLKAYCEIDPRVSRLGLLAREFAKVSQIHSAKHGGMSSFALDLMLIHFLQQCDPPVLPVLQQLMPAQQRSITVEGHRVKYFQDLDRIQRVWPQYRQNTKTDGELLVEFFIYYTTVFDFELNVVSIRQKDKMYKSQLQSKRISIQDPFLPAENVARNLDMSMNKLVKSSFIRARNHFTNFQAPESAISTLPSLLSYLFNESILKDTEMMKSLHIGCSICRRLGHSASKCPSKQKND